LEKEYDRYSEPILLIEEPEAHLHPSAVRVFWQFLKGMPGQKIITTHSGDIISAIPFSKIRRIVGVSGINRVKKLSNITFTPRENRSLNNFITYSRGELFFARCWLLVEGETEQAFFENLLNKDGFFDKKGIRIIQFAQIGGSISTVLKLAEQLSMRWFLISDGDHAGHTNTQKALDVVSVAGRQKDDYIYIFAEKTVEIHLMINSFASFYENYLSPSNQQDISVSGLTGTPYYEKLYYLLDDQKRNYKISKPEIILEIVEDIIQNGKSCPPIITQLRAKLEGIL
jgi:putative ATP-dependent endonuclease of OLD family